IGFHIRFALLTIGTVDILSVRSRKMPQALYKDLLEILLPFQQQRSNGLGLIVRFYTFQKIHITQAEPIANLSILTHFRTFYLRAAPTGGLKFLNIAFSLQDEYGSYSKRI